MFYYNRSRDFKNIIFDPCTVNKVCASGMKATQIGFDTIKSGTNEVVITGGQESMSNVPFIMGRGAPKYGGDAIKDLINHDGLTDAYTGTGLRKLIFRKFATFRRFEGANLPQL